MRDASSEVYAAVRLALMADAQLLSLVADRVSIDWALKLEPPFMRLDIPAVRAFKPDGGGGPGSDYTLHVHVFTKERGTAQRAQIVDRVLAALDEKQLPLATSSMWWLLHAGTILRTDHDDPTLQTARIEFSTTSTDGT